MTPLTITILGAGISGFTAALALRQQGHYVTVLEKSLFLREAGAAIHLGPNCSGILQRLGMNPFTAGANLLTGLAQYSGNGELKMKMDLREINKQWTNPWLLIHRMDLHGELERLALCPNGLGPVPEIHLSCAITQIDVHAGTVELEDGRVFRSDVIVGADGNFSFARSQIEPHVQPYSWGKACYRWLISREELLSDPETRHIVGEKGWFTEVSGGDRRFIMYPCRNNKQMNFAVFIPSEEATASGADWDERWNRATVLKAFERFFPAAQKLLAHAPDTVKVWQLYDLETLRSWTKGLLALIGDAAHPFIPFLGQGGAMAIEDAASIAQVLPADTTTSEVAQRLQLYQHIRHERVTWVQEQTRINGMDEDKRPAVKGGLTLLAYCHNHDEWENSAGKLKEWLQEKRPVNGV